MHARHAIPSEIEFFSPCTLQYGTLQLVLLVLCVLCVLLVLLVSRVLLVLFVLRVLLVLLVLLVLRVLLVLLVLLVLCVLCVLFVLLVLLVLRGTKLQAQSKNTFFQDLQIHVFALCPQPIAEFLQVGPPWPNPMFLLCARSHSRIVPLCPAPATT